MTEEILKKAERGEQLTGTDILTLLQRKEEKDELFAAARRTREKVMGNKVFTYGFVYFSTYCKNSCSFCYFRHENSLAPRYRKEKENIVRTAVRLRDSGVNLIDLTTGDDPYYTGHPDRLAEIVRAVRENTGLGVMVSSGVLDQNGIRAIAHAGADWYALYQETYDRQLFGRLRLQQSYEARMRAKLFARAQGLLIEEGLLTGVSDTAESRTMALLEMRKIGFDQVRVMTFIPQEGAPLAGTGKAGDFEDELMTIAVMRLLFPDALIPASLDVDGLDGLEARLNAGASVVTSIVAPKEGYAGVANSVRDIDDGYRTISGIQSTLGRCGLTCASAEEYRHWIEERKRISCAC